MEKENQQQLLAKLAMEKNERASQLFMEKLDNTRFPAERLDISFLEVALRAVMKTAPVYHRISLQEFLKVVVLDKERDLEEKNISFFQFGILSNSIEAISPAKLGLGGEEYEIIVTELIENVAFYNTEVAKFRDEIAKMVDEETAMKAAALNALRPVKE